MQDGRAGDLARESGAAVRLSLVVPTRERAAYLGACLDSALAADVPGFEIVVCDNASADDTQAVIASRADPRLRSVRQDRRVSMRMNFETGLRHARGEYVCFIGDDDAVLPGQLGLLIDLLGKHRPDVLSWTPMSYGWPVGRFEALAGWLGIDRARTFGGLRAIDAAAAVAALGQAAVPDLPSIYHGVAARAFLNRIALADGTVFAGSIPDVYFGIRSVYAGGRFLLCDHPFSISGYGPASTGHAHHAYDSSDPRAAPAHRFAQEAAEDPLTDAVGHILSVPGVIFATLETVRARLDPVPPPPDYGAWYTAVMAAVRRGDASARDGAARALAAHAGRAGTATDLDGSARRAPARKAAPPASAPPPARLVLPWVALPGRIGGRSDVFGAAVLGDALLAQDGRAVLDGRWTPARARRAFLGRLARLALGWLLARRTLRPAPPQAPGPRQRR
jgi:hypothetical protein